MAFTPGPRSAADDSLSQPPSEPPGPDRARVARIRMGDAAAFEAMFREYYDPLCRYVAGYLGSRDAAEDVVQGVFARIWQDRQRWAVTDLGHYLYAAVRRRAISHLRHLAVRRRVAPSLLIETGRRAPEAADVDFEAEEVRLRLERALAALPPRTREAFVLSRGEGLSYTEVALRMNISHKTVGVHIGRALAFLRKLLE